MVVPPPLFRRWAEYLKGSVPLSFCATNPAQRNVSDTDDHPTISAAVGEAIAILSTRIKLLNSARKKAKRSNSAEVKGNAVQVPK